MSNLTPQDVALQKAVEDAVAENPDHGVVTSWVLVVHTTKFTEDGYQASTYPLRMMHNNQPPHLIHGLLNYVQDLLNAGYYDGSPEDDE